jgi:PAS domain S-box-containing protein
MTPSTAAATAVATLPEQQRLQLLIDAVVDYAIFMLTPDGIVASWNSGAERIKGYTADEIVGQHFSCFFTPADRAAGAPTAALATAAATGKYEAEVVRVRKSGAQFAAHVVIDCVRDQSGRLVGYAKVTRDISEQQAARERLRETQQRMQILIDGVIDYAIYMLTPEGLVASWNSGAERIKGYAADEIIGQHFSRFYTDADRAAGMPGRALATAAEAGKFEAEGTRVRKDGSTFAASVVLDALRDERGTLRGYAKITRDISERKKAEADLERARAALVQAQKMEAIGQLTGGIAHDFNNLLTVITNALEIIARPNVESARRTRIIDAAQRAADRGYRLNQQLLAFARRQPLHPTPTDINRAIGAFEAVLRRAAGDAVDLQVRLARGTCVVNVDSAQFESGLLNLVVNARDAMPNGGGLTIRSGMHSGAEVRQRVPSLSAAQYAWVTVEDTGTGMPPEVQARAFEPFFTTKETGKGSGLGLSQVYGFAAQSGGGIELTSEVGRGTKVTLYLPISESPVPLGERTIAPEEAMPRAAGAILLVEDDPEVLEVTVETLRGLGYAVRSAANGPAALRILDTGEPFDILFTDVVMPRGMTGVDLARAARDRRPALGVLLASGYPTTVLEAQPGASDDFAFISKPYRWTELADKLRRLAPAR